MDQQDVEFCHKNPASICKSILLNTNEEQLCGLRLINGKEYHNNPQRDTSWKQMDQKSAEGAYSE